MKKQNVNITLFLIFFFSLLLILLSVGAFYLINHQSFVNINYSISSDVLLLSILIGISSLIVISLRQIDYLNASLKRWEFCEIYLRQTPFDFYLSQEDSNMHQIELVVRSMIARNEIPSEEEIRNRYDDYVAKQMIERLKLPIGKMKLTDINVKSFEVIKLDNLDRRTGLSTPIYSDKPFVDDISAWNEIPWKYDKSAKVVEYAFEGGALRGVIAWLGRNGWEPITITLDVGEKWLASRGLFKREVH